MNNPLLNGQNQPKMNALAQNVKQIKETWGMLRNLGNPQAMMEKLLGNSPAVVALNEVLKENGGDVQKAFMNKAKEMGVNPDEILDMLK